MFWLFFLAFAYGGVHPSPGLLVESCREDGSFNQAGVQEGDLILGWERSATVRGDFRSEPARGTFIHAFDLDLLYYLQEPLGLVTLTLERKGRELNIQLPPGAMAAFVRPVLSGADETVYLKGLLSFEEGRFEDGLAVWHGLVLKLEGEQAAWLFQAMAMRYVEARRLEEADPYFKQAVDAVAKPRVKALILRRQARKLRNLSLFPKAIDTCLRALQILESTPSLLIEAELLGELATSYARFGELDKSGECLDRAERILRKESKDSMAYARGLMRIGLLSWTRGDLVKARDMNERAAAIQKRLNPRSVDLASSLENVGLFAAEQGRYDLALQVSQEALSIIEKSHPNSATHARILLNLGKLAEDRGDLLKAEELFHQSLVLFENMGTYPLDRAHILTILGELASYRGDYIAAESYGWKALDLKKALAPKSRDISLSLMSLGRISMLRGDLDSAEQKLQEALELIKQIAPNGLDHARILGMLGRIQQDHGKLEEAERCFLQALAINEIHSPDSLLLAQSLTDLGKLIWKKGDPSRAEPYLLKSLNIRERLAPQSLDQAVTLQYLGLTAQVQGDLELARHYFSETLAIREQLAPGSELEAKTLFLLAFVTHKTNRCKEAANLMVRGLDALEEQMGRLGGTLELQSGFAAKFQDRYWDVMDIYVQQGRLEEAFHLYERSRAQILRRMMAEKNQLMVGDIPESLMREKKTAGMNYEKLQHQISKLHPERDRDQIEVLLVKLRDLRKKRQRIHDKIQTLSPKLAQFQNPQALDLEQVQAALDPGTLLLSYAVGVERSYLFAVTKPEPGQDNGFQVFSLNVGREDLELRIGAFHKWLMRPWTTGHLEHGLELYGALLTPVQSLIDGSDRVLISPDGPLRRLAFGALSRSKEPGDYLIAQKPLHITASTTLYAEVAKQRPRVQSIELVAVGNPNYSEAAGDTPNSDSNIYLRSAIKRGYTFEPLPGTRRELVGISQVLGDDSQIFMGAAATEGVAKAVSSDAPYLHFACHGVLDEQSPLDSALALSIPKKWRPGQENGFLQAWEVMEQIKLDAELVVLSACDSGLGASMGGEGFLGLTRAFQFAGARSVAASLWKVSDASTASLMTQFYQYLKSGKTKDQALRLAQLDMINLAVSQDQAGEKNYAHPFFWAAFQLIGDWR